MSEVHTPGPWKVGNRAIDVGCENDKLGGYAKLFDVRGWGYLTGRGHGGLGLDDETAYEIQKANAALAAAAPELLAALKEARDKGLIYWEPNTERGHVAKADMLARIDAAIAKAEPSEKARAALSRSAL